VQIYGRINAGLDNYEAKGATAGSAADLKSRNRVYDYTSRIGFRGTENLGGGLQAVFLMESGLNVDTGSQAGQAGLNNTSSGFLSSRIGHIGLQGNWGLVTFGRSNVWWGNGRNDQTSANYVSGNTVGLFSGTFGRGMGVGVTRQSSTLQYTSPTFNGFNAVLSYSPQSQEAGGVAGCAAANAGTNPGGTGACNTDGKLLGLTLQGTVGQFFGGYDYVKSEGNKPLAANQGSNTGNKFRIGWGYQPGAQVSLLWIRTKLENGGAAGGGGVDATSTGVSQTAWGLSWEHVFGNIQALAQYGKVRDATGCTLSATCANTNATQYMVGGRYLMSKRTAAYLTYGQTRNASGYNQDYLGGSYTAAAPAGAAALAVGADPRIWALGVIHNF
jgi:predicted porin